MEGQQSGRSWDIACMGCDQKTIFDHGPTIVIPKSRFDALRAIYTSTSKSIDSPTSSRADELADPHFERILKNYNI